MQDEQGKTRRNLVAFSSAIILMQWLQLPPGGTILGLNVAGVEPYRAWVAAMVVLIYLLLRYHFAPESVAQRDAWAHERTNIRLALVILCVRSAFTQRRAGTVSFDVSFTFDHWDLVGRKPTITLDFQKLKFQDKTYVNEKKGVVHVQMARSYFGNDDDERAAGGMASIDFTVSNRRHRQLAFKAWLHSLRPSWHVLESGFPYLLSAGAFCLIIERLLAPAAP